MCWLNYMAIPIVLKKPLGVYKVGTVLSFGGFISLYRDFRYPESQTLKKDQNLIGIKLWILL